MTLQLNDAVRVALIGIGATATMDLWLLALNRMGVPTLNFAFIGRWAGHLLKGQFMHRAIARAEPVRGEAAIGWAVHYGTGVAFAAVLGVVSGAEWLGNPRLWPALAVGLGSVVAPLFVMQPAMGAGVASSKTATPWKNRLRSVANHTVFGLGLFLSAMLINEVFQ